MKHYCMLASILAVVIPFLQPSQLCAQTIGITNGRQEILINQDWMYAEINTDDLTAVVGQHSAWHLVHLPHTWNRTDAVDPMPGYRRAASWYRKGIEIPNLPSGQRVLLSFEGANIVTDVYVNGNRAGGHIGGYVGFEVDLTDHLVFGRSNDLLVRVSNAYDPDIIPSQKSDFHIYGGITRDVRLLSVPPRHLRAIRIQTPQVSERAASVVLDADVFANEQGIRGTVQLAAVVKNDEGAIVSKGTASVTLRPGMTTHRIPLPDVKSPRLWSPDEPVLYTVEVSMTEGRGVVDKLADRIGFRWFEFVEHGPFKLNGKRLLLRGTHRHEDYAGLANAMPNELHRRDMKMIKEMGANFVRLAHYPQDPEVYKACDELGLLVWDELPWCRGGMGGEAWKEHTTRLLREQILRYYNHPSIIIRSLGNEFYWLPDVEGGDNLDSLRTMLTVLNSISHELDPGRSTATRKFTEGADLVDIVSPSMWPGWYSGVYKGFEKAIADARKKYKRFFHAEYGGDSHIGRHTDTPVDGEGLTVPDGWEENIKPTKIKNVSQFSDWGESYMVNLFDWYLHISERTEWFTGNAQWAFKDFPTPLRPENPIPYVNQKGLVDRAGMPKDAYYVFKSYWTTSPEFCYIQSHTWKERSGPVGVKRDVKVFSNCPEVELVLNGTSLGRRTRDIAKFPASGLVWNVGFSEGKNDLVARGFRAGKAVAIDTLQVQYSYRKHDQPDHIELRTEPQNDGSLMVIAIVVDKDGTRCLDYQKRVYFTSDGGGRLRINGGTPTRSSVIEMANGVARIEFEPERGKRTVIEARNQDFKGAYVIVE